MGPLFAKGKYEESLERADELIGERRYNDAILELTAFARKNPDSFADAQKRLQRIVRLREAYNQMAADLLDVLVNDPTNDERKLAMIKQLEAVDAAPNRAAREFLVRTKESAQFTYYKAMFEKIMEEGRELIDRRAFIEAGQKYSEGFELYRDDFYAAGYRDEVIQRVNAQFTKIDESMAEFALILEELLSAIELCEESARYTDEDFPDRSNFLPAWTKFEELFLSFASLRNKAAHAGRSLENEFLLLQGEFSHLNDNSFLPFAFRFILGRKTEIQPEGIVGALDTLIIELLNRGEVALSSLLEAEYKDFLLHFDSQNENALVRLADLKTYAQTGRSFIGLWSSLLSSEALPSPTPLGRTIVFGKAPIYLYYHFLTEISDYEEKAFLLTKDLAGHQNLQLPKDFIDLEVKERESLREGWVAERLRLMGVNREIIENIAILREKEAYIQNLLEKKLSTPPSPDLFTHARLAFEAAQEKLIRADTDYAWFIYTSGEEDNKLALLELSRAIDRAEPLIAGLSSDSQDGGEVEALLSGAYPDRALLALKAEADPFAHALRKQEGEREALSGEAEYIQEDERLLRLARSMESRLSAIQALELRREGLVEMAERRVAEAENARREAERFYNESRLALGRENFDLARDRLRRSEERYNYSLERNESETLRRERDNRLLSLSTEIVQTENLIVIRDVRRLIGEAQNLYYGGNFERAEEQLVQADLRWRTTNVEDESEIVFWLGLVRGALSVRSGRTIMPTAPLYPEMSQLLSFAQKSFDEGRTFLNTRRRAEALERFEEAERYIREVQVIFPLNQDASLLLLRIEQVRDPVQFNESFRNKVQMALGKEGSAPQEAYTELQDLYAINPRYAGLKGHLERIEVRLGLRLPPPDPRALRRSDELTRDARRIIDANVRAQFPVALEQLNEAIRLNPNNESAVNLKVRIQIDAGGSANIVLPFEVQRDYEMAVAEFQKGNTIVANAIVERLLQNPANRRSPKILELQKRIQSRL